MAPGTFLFQPGESESVVWNIGTEEGEMGIYAAWFSEDEVQGTPTKMGVVVQDRTPPPTPGNLRTSTCTIDGDTRFVSLTWDAFVPPDAFAFDENFDFFRVERVSRTTPFVGWGIQEHEWEFLLNTSALFFISDPSPSNHMVAYRVKAFDKALNSSDWSPIKVYEPNECA